MFLQNLSKREHGNQIAEQKNISTNAEVENGVPERLRKFCGQNGVLQNGLYLSIFFIWSFMYQLFKIELNFTDQSIKLPFLFTAGSRNRFV